MEGSGSPMKQTASQQSSTGQGMEPKVRFDENKYLYCSFCDSK